VEGVDVAFAELCQLMDWVGYTDERKFGLDASGD
jgi:hypothetical protein